MNFMVGILMILFGIAMMSSDEKKKGDGHKQKLLDSMTSELDELERQEQALRQEVEGS